MPARKSARLDDVAGRVGRVDAHVTLKGLQRLRFDGFPVLRLGRPAADRDARESNHERDFAVHGFGDSTCSVTIRDHVDAVQDPRAPRVRLRRSGTRACPAHRRPARRVRAMVGRPAEDQSAVRQRRRQGPPRRIHRPAVPVLPAEVHRDHADRREVRGQPQGPEIRAEALADQHGVQRGREPNPASLGLRRGGGRRHGAAEEDGRQADRLVLHAPGRDDPRHRAPGGGGRRQDHGFRRAIRAGDPRGQDRRRAGLVASRRLDAEFFRERTAGSGGGLPPQYFEALLDLELKRK